MLARLVERRADVLPLLADELELGQVDDRLLGDLDGDPALVLRPARHRAAAAEQARERAGVARGTDEPLGDVQRVGTHRVAQADRDPHRLLVGDHGVVGEPPAVLRPGGHPRQTVRRAVPPEHLTGALAVGVGGQRADPVGAHPAQAATTGVAERAAPEQERRQLGGVEQQGDPDEAGVRGAAGHDDGGGRGAEQPADGGQDEGEHPPRAATAHEAPRDEQVDRHHRKDPPPRLGVAADGAEGSVAVGDLADDGDDRAPEERAAGEHPQVAARESGSQPLRHRPRRTAADDPGAHPEAEQHGHEVLDVVEVAEEGQRREHVAQDAEPDPPPPGSAQVGRDDHGCRERARAEADVEVLRRALRPAPVGPGRQRHHQVATADHADRLEDDDHGGRAPRAEPPLAEADRKDEEREDGDVLQRLERVERAGDDRPPAPVEQGRGPKRDVGVPALVLQRGPQGPRGGAEQQDQHDDGGREGHPPHQRQHVHDRHARAPRRRRERTGSGSQQHVSRPSVVRQVLVPRTSLVH